MYIYILTRTRSTDEQLARIQTCLSQVFTTSDFNRGEMTGKIVQRRVLREIVAAVCASMYGLCVVCFARDISRETRKRAAVRPSSKAKVTRFIER